MQGKIRVRWPWGLPGTPGPFGPGQPPRTFAGGTLASCDQMHHLSVLTRKQYVVLGIKN